jgi:beta-galactosidase
MGGTHMEACGLMRGTATYRVCAEAGRDILLKGVADIVQGWRNADFQGARVSGGQWQLYHGLPPGNADSSESDSWQFRTDSWGHSNFDDARLPSMRIASPKGISGIFQVNRTDSSELMWRFQIHDVWLPDRLEATMDPMSPILSPNSWNSTRMPLIASYSVHWTLQEGSDSCAMELSSPEAETAIYVDGCLAGVYNAFDPWFDLSGLFNPGQTRTITLLCRKRHWADPAGVPKIHHLTCLHPEIVGCSDRDMEKHPFASHGMMDTDGRTGVSMPDNGLPLVPGEAIMVSFALDGLFPSGMKQAPCLQARIKGVEMKAMGLFNGHLLGRVFGKSACRPAIVGGDPELLYLPGPWFKEKDNLLILVVEGIGDGAILESAWLEA